jgi:CBS domain-containing protein
MSPLSNATVADAMHEGVVYCEPDATLTDVARAMATNRVHCIAVHATAAGRPDEPRVWGIISDLDLMRAGIHIAGDRPAGTIAHTPVISVRPTLPLAQACEAMLTHNVSHVVIIDPDAGRPVGILSTLDIAGALAGSA